MIIFLFLCNNDTSCEDKVNAITNGTYLLCGGDERASYTANKAVIESMFGTGCGTEYNVGSSDANFSCSVGSFIVEVDAVGNVSAYILGISESRISSDGSLRVYFI